MTTRLKWLLMGLGSSMAFAVAATMYGNYGGAFSLFDPASNNTAAVTASNELKVSCTTGCLGGGGTVVANQGTPNIAANGWPVYLEFGGVALPLGQATMANSVPVVISSNQTVVPASQSGTWMVQPGNTANTTPWLFTVNQGGNSATVTAGNALKVDNSAVTQPVSGTVTANQGGTWIVQPGNTANTTPWLFTINQGGNSATVTGANALKVDGSGITQPVSAASLPLPSGAATSANQPTNAAAGSTTAGSTGNVGLGAVTTSAPSYTTGQNNFFSLTLNGALREDISSVAGTVTDTNTGNATAGTQRVVLASNQPAVTVISSTTDPCQASSVSKSSAIVNVGSATTVQIVALASSKVIYVCNFAVTVTGTTPTFKWQYGTGAACATGTTDLTGAFAATSGGFVQDAGPGTIFSTATSNALCVVVTGTAPGVQGFVTYVQQ